MLPLGPNQSEWPAQPPRATVTSRFELCQMAMSGPLVLLKQRSMLIFVAHFTTGGHYWIGPASHQLPQQGSCPQISTGHTGMGVGELAPVLQQPWENCLPPSLTTATVEVALYACWRAGMYGLCMGELAMTLTQRGRSWWRPRLTNSTPTQAHIQGSKLVHPSSSPSMTCWGGWRDEQCGTMTQSNSRMPERSSNDDDVLEVRRLEPGQQLTARSIYNKTTGRMGVLSDTLKLPRPLQQKNLW